MKDEILREISDAVIRVDGTDPVAELQLDIPPKPELGDFAVGMFPLANQFRTKPADIAQRVADAIDTQGGVIASAEAVGPYVNVRIKNNALFGAVVACDLSAQPASGKRVMVEYLSPNTNKPLHLGHMRNGVLGMAIANLLKWQGHDVVTANLVNDRGVHICKSMIAWQWFAKGATPQSTGMKGDHFVGDYYVKFARVAKEDPSIEEEAQALLKRWEDGDESVLELWRTMNEWVYAGFAKTYETLGLLFDVFLYESETYHLGKDIIDSGLDRGIFIKDDSGAVIFELPEEVFGLNKDGSSKRVTVLRKDGTSVYMTQDIGTALKKADEYDLDASIYVVGSEQEYHFKCLFAILQALGYKWADNCYHLSYGMVELPDGKMKSREGNVIDADDLAKEMVDSVAEDLRKKHDNLSDDEIARRARKIGLGAIKFFLARVNPKQKIRFNRSESLSLDGVTGVYCQYAYARASGILAKAPQEWKSGADTSLLGMNTEERVLAQRIIFMEDMIDRAAQEYNPSIAAMAIYDLAKSFNQWYNKHYAIDEDDVATSKARLALVGAIAGVLENSLRLLGIECLEEM